MRKLSVSLKESRFVDLINKKFTRETRKEEEINLQRLKPIDIGTSVLWADNDLCKGGNYLFTFDEVTDMLKGSEWRLPTVSEVKELKRCKKEDLDGKYIFTNNGTSLTFYGHGEIFVLPSGKTFQKPNNNDDTVSVYGWTNDVSKYNNNYINIYLMDPSLFIVEKSNIIYKNSLLSARLVKDKKDK